MTGSSTPSNTSCQAVTSDLAAHALLTADSARLAELRRCPGPGPGQRLASSFLKNADEQTVVGLAAVCHAIHDHHLDETALADWGVVAGTKLFGRQQMVTAVQRFRAEGAWGISPNLIPHRSLHSLSGTISQALKTQGPNFGAGSAAEALYCAAGLLAEQAAPGIWLVLTSWEPEPLVAEKGDIPSESICAGLALALTPVQANSGRPRLAVTAGGPILASKDEPPFDLFRMHQLLELSLVSGRFPNHVVHPLADGGQIECACDAAPCGPTPNRALNGCARATTSAAISIAEGSP